MRRPALQGERVHLSPPTPRDRSEFLAAVAASQDLHEPWVYPPRDAREYALYLQRARRTNRRCFLARADDGKTLVGAVNVNEIVRGSLQQAFVGYYGFVDGVGCGLMRDAVRAVVRHCLDPSGLGLHRIEANIQPDNERSRALATYVGFRLEGFSPNYLRIAGVWRDHERWAITAEDLRSESSER